MEELLKKLVKGTVKEVKFGSFGEMLADLCGKTVNCTCGFPIAIEKNVLLQMHITCPDCGAVYENNAYDENAVKKVKGNIRKPKNCVYDFSEGIYPCLKKGKRCRIDCNYRSDEAISYAHGKCKICGGPLDYDGYCLSCD